MKKKIVGFLAALACAACAVPYCAAAAQTAEGDGVAVQTVWEGQEAIFLQSVSLERGEEIYSFICKFDKAVSDGSTALEEAKKSLIAVNGTLLSAIAGASAGYDAEDDTLIVFAVPASFFTEGEKVTAEVFGGLLSATDRVTTVRYTYEFSSSATQGKRIYRGDDVSAFDEVRVTSISAPTIESGNFTFKVYFSDSITSKKYIDLQAMDNRWLRDQYGEDAKNNVTSYSYTNAELNLLHSYQVYGWSNEHSLSHKLMFGCTEMNGLKAFFANTTQLDMTPKTTVNGLQAFSVRQLLESVAQEGISYSSDGEHFEPFYGSLQVLAVQIHIDSNFIQVVLKGDSLHDKNLKPVKTRRKVGENQYEYQDITSFHENLAPDLKQNMLFGLKAGLLLPNGKAVHKDAYFIYDYSRKAWISADQLTDTQPNIDDTLDNQMGLTEGELITLNKKK